MTTEQPRIKVTLIPGEPIKVEAINFSGSACLEATKSLREMGESDTELKQEFYEEVESSTQMNIEL